MLLQLIICTSIGILTINWLQKLFWGNQIIHVKWILFKIIASHLNPKVVWLLRVVHSSLITPIYICHRFVDNCRFKWRIHHRIVLSINNSQDQSTHTPSLMINLPLSIFTNVDVLIWKEDFVINPPPHSYSQSRHPLKLVGVRSFGRNISG